MTQRQLIKKYSGILRRMKGSFEEIFDAMFIHTDNPAFEFIEDGRMKFVEFYEIKSDILRVSKVIFDSFSKENGDYIALICENPIAWTTSFWAILAAGFKPYLVNQKLPQALNDRLMHQMPICGAFVDNEQAHSYGYKKLSFEDAKNNREKIANPVFADEIALSTSGTSGQEKIVFFSGKQICNQLKNSEKVITECKEVKKTYNGKLKLLLFLPLYHVFGLIAVYLWFGFFGQTIVLLDSYSPETILTTIRLHQVTHIFAVPLLWHGIEDKIKESVAKEDEKTQKQFWGGIEKITKIGSKHPRIANFIAKKALARVRCQVFGDSPMFCISGGSYIRSSALKLMNALGYHLRNGYGSTEIGITSVELSPYFDKRDLGSVGIPFANVSYKIEDGTLRVKSDCCCKGVLVDGVYHPSHEWFDTLDMAHSDESGRYYIDGRKTDLIIAENGENVNPDVIEQKFDFSIFPCVRCFCILGMGEEKEKVTLLLDISEQANMEELGSVQKYIDSVNESLPFSFKITGIYRVNKPLKEEQAIKVSRTLLKKKIEAKTIGLFPLLSLAKSEEDESDVLPIREIFASTLHLPLQDVKGSSHFLYDLGGTSLDYFSILEAISSAYGVEIEFNPDEPLATPNDFARYLRKGEKK